jgi:hypothetical protein
LLFGGAPIEEARWKIVATSLPFDRAQWPFPAFASRGAFGDAWTQVRYDPQTLEVIERRTIDAQSAAALPDARFAQAAEVEALLRQRIAGQAAPRAQSVCEVRSPIDSDRLRAVAHGGRIQFSTSLAAADLEVLAAFFAAHPSVQLRVHGFRSGFDAAQLERFAALRDLTLDVHRLQHAGAIANLHALQKLRLGAMQLHLEFLPALPALRALELHGTRAALAPLQGLTRLQSLTLENTAAIDLRALASAPVLHTLVLAHGDYDLHGLAQLRALLRLELRALDLRDLAPIAQLPQLEQLHLDGVREVRDLKPLSRLQALRELRISGMPQLNVSDFAPLRACAGLCAVEIDVGSRTKTREINRMLRSGNSVQS